VDLVSNNRPYDLVLFGATGFTGALTAEYLAAHAPADCRWALAGRNPAKLEAVRARLGAGHADLPLLHADVTDPASIREVAAATRVVITTVGPYVTYGEPLVAACAEAGTDYVDLTGEPEFVDLMYLRHHRTAVETGARIVHSCGFDSIPHDLGAYFTLHHLPKDVPVKIQGFLQFKATFSGGTMHSAVTAFSRGRQTLTAHRDRRRAEPPLEGRRCRAVAGKPHRVRGLGAWALPLPTIDPEVVRRSAVALDRYGPDFTYSHYVALDHLPKALGLVAGAGTVMTLAQIPPARNWLLDRKKPGDGPSAERRAKSWFTVHFVGEGGGARVITKVSGGDPGYSETAKMLAESALSLAFDDLPPSAGQLTTVAAMGDALLNRLQEAGIRFTVLKEEASA
jgi:short subunit dehydrogenase-like uncharacterized protein